MVRKRRESHVCEQCDEHIFHFPHSWKRGWEKSNGRYEIIWNVCVMSREKQQRTKILLFNLPRENITELELWARSDVPFPSTRKKKSADEKSYTFLSSTAAAADVGNMIRIYERLAAPKDLMTHTMCRMKCQIVCVYMTTEQRWNQNEKTMSSAAEWDTRENNYNLRQRLCLIKLNL